MALENGSLDQIAFNDSVDVIIVSLETNLESFKNSVLFN